MKRSITSAIVAAALLIGVACSNGGTVPPPVGPTAGPMGSGVLVVTIPKPVAPGIVKAPAYTSPATQSVSIAGSGIATQTFNVAPLPSAICPLVGSNYVCTITFTAPIGSYNIIVTTFSGLNGGGSVLTQNAVAFVISTGTPTPVNAVLNGVVKTLVLSVTPVTRVSAGTPTVLTATWGGQDAAGNAIIGGGTLVDSSGAPIVPTLTASDATHFAIGSLSGGSWTVNYVGGGSGTPTLTLAAAGLTSVVQTITIAPVATATPIPTPIPTATPTSTATPAATPTPQALIVSPNPISLLQTGPSSVTLTESGFSGPITAVSGDTGILTVASSPVTMTAGTATVDISAVASGSTTLSVSDGSLTVVVPVHVTISGVIISKAGTH